MDQVFKEYEEEDFTFECFGVEKFWTEDKVKEVMQKLDNDYYCVMDPNIVMFETFFKDWLTVSMMNDMTFEWFVQDLRSGKKHLTAVFISSREENVSW